MFSMPGTSELIIIFAVLFLLFGAKKLPALGGAIGESIKNFKKGVRELENESLVQTTEKTPKDSADTNLGTNESAAVANQAVENKDGSPNESGHS